MTPLGLHVMKLAKQADRKDKLIEALLIEGLSYEIIDNDILVPAAAIVCKFRWSGIYYSPLQPEPAVVS